MVIRKGRIRFCNNRNNSSKILPGYKYCHLYLRILKSLNVESMNSKQFKYITRRISFKNNIENKEIDICYV